jgi:hypothetical protein
VKPLYKFVYQELLKIRENKTHKRQALFRKSLLNGRDLGLGINWPVKLGTYISLKKVLFRELKI